jgi:hypothetical protein
MSIGEAIRGCVLALAGTVAAGCALEATEQQEAPLAAQAKDAKPTGGAIMTGAWWKAAMRPRAKTPDLVAWTTGGEIAIADGATGAVKHAAPALALGGSRDVVHDRWNARALVFEGGGAGSGGEIAAYPIGAGGLGARAHLAAQAGDARLLATPGGALVFSDAGGDRWSVIGSSGSVAAPRPMSAWIGSEGGATSLSALAYGPAAGELDRVRAKLENGAIAAVSVEPLAAEAASIPPSARVVPAPARGGALLLDVAGSFLTVRGAGDASPAGMVPLAAAGMRIEGAVALGGGEVVVLLLSGTTELAAIAIGPDRAPASLATLALPGQPAHATRFLSHDLVAQGNARVAAATSAGVFSVEVSLAPSGVALALAPGFDGAALRGPIAAIDGG